MSLSSLIKSDLKTDRQTNIYNYSEASVLLQIVYCKLNKQKKVVFVYVLSWEKYFIGTLVLENSSMVHEQIIVYNLAHQKTLLSAVSPCKQSNKTQ